MDLESATLPRSLTLSPSAPRVRMTVGAGSVGQKTWNLRRPVTLIGSQRTAQIVLHDDSVSKAHCAIINTGNAVLLRDLASRSGTRCNEQSVEAALLSDGNVLQIGPTTVQVAINVGDVSEETGVGLRLDDPLVQPTPLTLTVDGPDGRSHTFTIDQSTAVIGRSPGCTVQLEHDEVSLAHALIFTFDGRAAICDLGSRAGLKINGTAESLTLLGEGDLIKLGPYGVKVHLQAAEQLAPRASAIASAPASVPVASPQPPLAVTAAAPEVSLADLEQEMSATWARWNDCQGTLRQSAAVLEGRQRELLARAGELDRQDAQLRGQLHDLERLRKELETREQALKGEREHVDRAKAAYEQSQSTAEATAALRRHEIEATAASLDQRRAQLETLAAELDAQRQKLDERGAQLDARQLRFEQRERRIQEMERMLSQLQAMFGQFSALNADIVSAAGSIFAESAPRPKRAPS